LNYTVRISEVGIRVLSASLSRYICILQLLRIYCKIVARAIYSNLFHFLTK